MSKSNSTADKNSLIIYRRILRLDELFSAETYPSLQELIEDEQVSASRTTIFRTIEFIRRFAPFAYRKLYKSPLSRLVHERPVARPDCVRQSSRRLLLFRKDFPFAITFYNRARTFCKNKNINF